MAALLVALAGAGCGASRRSWVVPDEPAGSSSSIEIWRRAPVSDEATAALSEAKRLRGLGRTADAFGRAMDAVDADPSCLEAHRLLQDLLVRSTADWWLRERYERRLRDFPDDADSWYYLARFEPEPELQLDLFDEALTRDPRHPYASLGRAVVLARRGDVREAVSAAGRATEFAPWLALPWIWLGSESLKRGDPGAASRFYTAARDRAADDVRAWLGLSQAAEELAQRGAASRSSLEALRLAPGDETYAWGAVETLCQAGVRSDLEAAVEVVEAAARDGAPLSVVSALRGRLLLALGRSAEAVSALEAAVASGASADESAQPLRLARVLCGRYRQAVRGALSTLPPDALLSGNLYAPRWERLRSSCDEEIGDARSLLRLAEAMASVGWLAESRAVLVAARARAPDDERIARRAAAEVAFGGFVLDLGRIGRESRYEARRRPGSPTVEALLSHVSASSRARLGYDAAGGATLRSYPFLGAFALSVASDGAFETTFGSHGLSCLVGARSGASAELVLGRIIVLRRSPAEQVLSEPAPCDECWVESDGLPTEANGLRRGLAGLTLDRFVTLQIDTIRRAPRPPVAGLPFARRRAATREERRSLDTPSDVSARIEQRLEREGRLDGAAIDAVRRHELVHVADAARMLPFSEHPIEALSFVISHGLSSESAERSLEARAQVLSMIAAREPRLALASLLAFLPAREGETPHAAAYRIAAQIAVDEILADPAAFPSIDLAFNVLQQIDVLGDDEVRELGRRLAARF